MKTLSRKQLLRQRRLARRRGVFFIPPHLRRLSAKTIRRIEDGILKYQGKPPGTEIRLMWHSPVCESHAHSKARGGK